MRSSRVVLSNESQELYDELLARFIHLFSPRDILEDEYVSSMVNARWRLRRLESSDTANIELAIIEARPEFEKKFNNLSVEHEQALAFRGLAKTIGNCDAFGRYEDRQHRVFDRSYRLIAKHRGKSGAIPSPDLLRENEASLPPSNFIASDPPEPQPDDSNRTFEPEPQLEPPQLRNESNDPETANCTFEPEMPAEPPPQLNTEPAEPKKTNSRKSKAPRNPNFAYEEEFLIVKPLFEALKPYPELRKGVADAIAEYKNKLKASLAA
jgi:hypothetical protein